MKILNYKKELDYSFTPGAFATMELIKTRPEAVKAVCLHSHFNGSLELEEECRKNKIQIVNNDKIFRQTKQKENTYVLGVFKKYTSYVNPNLPHVVLVNPSDMGNLGTIIRTLAGFNLGNLVIITPSADIWDPRTVRASMGAIFHIQFQHCHCIEQYIEQYPAHSLYPFMLDGEVELRPENITKQKRYTLVFGNEARGLAESFRSLGTSVRISQSNFVDSLNLSISVAIGAYVFTI